MDERGKILECYQIGKKGKFSVFVCIQKAQGDIKWKWVCFKRRADYVILIVWLTFEFQSFSVFGKTPSASYFYGFTSIFECFLSSVAFFQSLANWTQSCSTILDIVIIAHMLFTVWTHRNRIKMEKRNHYFVSWTLSESFLRPRDGKKAQKNAKNVMMIVSDVLWPERFTRCGQLTGCEKFHSEIKQICATGLK